MLQESVRPQPLSSPADAPARTALRVGLLGLGTVGAGTYRVLARNQPLIRARTGQAIAITRVAVRDLARAATVVGAEVRLTTDPFAVVTDPAIDVVVEVIGGTTLARELVLQAIAHGKHVVTANKALLAEHGAEIFAAAEARGVVVAYEGAVAVSIPIIKALREGLVANRIEWLAGIVNGTSNFILSEMQAKGISFASALQAAQALGYAEADPRLDVDGTDAAHKLSLLAANAFGVPIPYAQVQAEGIEALAAADMAYAAQLGYRIKLLAQARRTDAGLLLQVHPALLPQDHLLANVQGSMNAVMVHSDAAGSTLYYGAGAGSEQTASAVIADLVDLARASGLAAAQRVPHLGFQSQALQSLPQVAASDAANAWYLRLHSCELARSIPAVQQLLAQAGVGLRQQHNLRPATATAPAALVLLTAPLPTHRLRPLLQQLAQVPGITDVPCAVRMARLD